MALARLAASPALQHFAAAGVPSSRTAGTTTSRHADRGAWYLTKLKRGTGTSAESFSMNSIGVKRPFLGQEGVNLLDAWLYTGMARST